jgi:hypothetical protein
MKKLLAVLMLGISSHAWAIGEIIAVKTTGTQYCHGLKPAHFTPSSSTPLFLRLDNNQTVSAFIGSLKNTPDLVMDLQYDAIGTYTASFSLGYYDDAFNHVEVIGRAKADKTGLVKTITGTFIRVGLLDNCYAVGKLTGKRIN